MRISKGSDNSIKNGRYTLYLNKNYDKSIEIHWDLRFNPINFNLAFDGSECGYIFTFWCVWVFYINLNNIFNYYPKEWNSFANNNQGGYLNSARRTIGISQYDWNISLYFWHDGEESYYKDKDIKIYHKFINLIDIFCGDFCYHTIDEIDSIENICLPENNYNVDIHCRFWHKKWKRFYMKNFNCKGKSITISSDIKYPCRKLTIDDIKYGTTPEDLEKSMKSDIRWFPLKSNKPISDAVMMYKDIIIKKRSEVDANWVPSEYKKFYEREEKLKRILNG